MGVPRRSNQSILKEISPEYSLEGLMLKLKIQYFGHLMQRVDPLEKTLMLGKIEGRKRRGRLRMRCSKDSKDTSLSKLQEIMKDREAWYTVVHGVTELDMTEQQRKKVELREIKGLDQAPELEEQRQKQKTKKNSTSRIFCSL